MNTIQTIIEGFIALCFLTLALIGWLKWSRDTAIMWTVISVTSCMSAYAPLPTKAFLILTWVVLIGVTILGVIDPEFFTKLIGSKDKLIVNILATIGVTVVLVVTAKTNDGNLAVSALIILILMWALLPKLHKGESNNPQSASVTPIAAAPHVPETADPYKLPKDPVNG